MVNNPPALGAGDCHLLRLGNIDRNRGQQLHHWLREVRAAARKEVLRCKKNERTKIMEYMTEVRRQQRVRTPRVLRQRSMEDFVAGLRTNMTFMARQTCTIPEQLGRDPTTKQLMAQSELQESVQDLDND